MTVPILVCECGMRVRAPGATPGRVGRCPKCGGRLQVPDAIPRRQTARKQAKSPPAGEIPQAGYRLDPSGGASARTPVPDQPIDAVPPRAAYVVREKPPPMTDGLLRVLDFPDKGWFSSLLFPLRGAEALGMIALLSTVFWVFTILVPEYCLSLMATAESTGYGELGQFIALLTFLPVVFLAPFAIFYWMQYLARVLVSSAMGETAPPRPPDRNFEGFVSGLFPWLVWLLLGVVVGLAPLFSYWVTHRSEGAWNPLLGLALFALAIPYIVMALMMSLLHDNAFAAMPWAVLGAIFRLGRSFLLLCLFIACLNGVFGATFLIALVLRPRVFWVYLFFTLGCWIAVDWISIASMRILGTYYYDHRNLLDWHRERPRWGVAWKL